MTTARWRAGTVTALLAVLWVGVGQATEVTVPLQPDDTQLGLTVYVMGLFAQPGLFHRFAGALTVGPAAAAGRCRVELRIEMASLQMDDPARTRAALGPELLDAAHYPDQVFSGACAGRQIAGALTLHGNTHNLTLTMRRSGETLIATGNLHRDDFGIRGMPGLIGGRVDMRVTIALPPGVAARLVP